MAFFPFKFIYNFGCTGSFFSPLNLFIILVALGLSFFSPLNLFITLAAWVCLRCRMRALSAWGKRGYSSCGAWASHSWPFLLQRTGSRCTWPSLAVGHGLQAQLPCSMWDLCRPGIEPVSPTLAGRFWTTDHEGSPWINFTSSSPSHPLFWVQLLSAGPGSSSVLLWAISPKIIWLIFQN